MGLKIETLLEDKESLRELLLQGSDKARQVAEKNLKEIKYNMGYVVWYNFILFTKTYFYLIFIYLSLFSELYTYEHNIYIIF